VLNAIIRFALRYRPLIVVLSLGCLVYGSYQATTLPIDVFPDMDRPRVVVITESPGLATEEVEKLVTFPIESAVLGASGVMEVRSSSVAGLSVVNINFAWNAEIHRARQVVQERLASVQQDLPPGVRPQMAPIASLLGQIMLVGVYSQPGPKGGVLSPAGKTGVWAELLHDPEVGTVSLFLWQSKDSKEVSSWTPFEPSARDVEVTWEIGRAAPAVAPAPGANGSEGIRLVLSRVAGSPNEFRGSDLRLRESEGGTRFGQVERRLRLGGSRPDIVFPSFLQRQMDVRTTADWVLRPRLRKIPGVAQVVVMGGGRKQYQVLVDPRALLEHDVTLHQVEEAVRESNVSASGGFVVRSDRELPVVIESRAGPGTRRVLKQLEEIPVRNTKHRPILVRQLGRVVEAPQVKRGDAGIDGHPGVVLAVTKQPHSDTRGVTVEAEEALREASRSLPLDVVINTELFQTKRFIDNGIYNVSEALVIGAILVLIVLFLFLLNLRTTFISLLAIPMSLTVTAIVFRAIGWMTGTELSINVMTLGGIAVALGELVDDAVVDVENIYRRLRENRGLPNPRSALKVIYEASIEVRSAIVFGTMMVILVFLPLFALSGIEGRLFTPLGIAYIVSILASLLVSLTLTPVLSWYLFAPESPVARLSQGVHTRRDSPLLRVLKWLATGLIRFSMRYAALLLLLTWALVAGCVLLLSSLGSNFLPPFDEGSVQIDVSLPSGSSLEASNETVARVDARLISLLKSNDNPDGPILHFVRRTGRAELDEHVEPVCNTEYILNMNPALGKRRDEVIRELQKELEDLRLGASVEVEQPLAHILSHILSGVNAQIAIKIHGDDLNTLRRTAEQIQAAIRTVPGLTPPVIESQQHVEELHVRLRPDDLAFHGVRRKYVADYLQTALSGEVVSQVLEGERRFDLMVRLDEPFRSDYSTLKRLRLELPNKGGQVSLGDLADVELGVGPNTVSRENARRRIAVRCNVQGRDLGSVVADLKERMREKVSLPPGYFVEYGGQFQSQQRATTLISVLALVALVGMFLVLYLLYPSARIVLQILNALPTAFIGGVLALWLTGQTMSVASMVGFISLGGIAARNGILLVSHYFHLMKYEGEGFTKEMVLRGSLERLSPVLMTALTAGIALVPLVVAGHQPGREILYPVASVILGGLVTSTFCEFLIHPGIFWQFSGKDAEHLARTVGE
jgi:CzcA family heavy metal efflux pump